MPDPFHQLLNSRMRSCLRAGPLQPGVWMSHAQSRGSSTPRLLLPILCGVALLAACSREESEPHDPQESTPLHRVDPEPGHQEAPEPPHQLLPAEIALAHTHLEANRPDLALAILATQPDHPETLRLLESTHWHQPDGIIDHSSAEIRHIALHGGSLWAGLTQPPFDTVVRWDLEAREIRAVLFPTRDPLRHFVLSPTATHAVVTRGDVSLLIDAQSLEPITDLGAIPAGITPESAITFSADSVLLAHPGDGAWFIRDTQTGEAIRMIENEKLPPAPILAAHLASSRLRLLDRQGTRIDIPLSPVESIAIHPFDEEPLEILHAHFIGRGDTALIIRHPGPHDPPVAMEFDLTENPVHGDLDIDAWATRQAHSTLPGLASGLLRHIRPAAVEFTPTAVIFPGQPKAPLATTSAPVAFAADPDTRLLATADADGRIALHQPASPPEHPTTESLTLLARHAYDPATASLNVLHIPSRQRDRDTPPRQRGWDILSQSVVGTSCPDNPLTQRLQAALPTDTPDPTSPAQILATAFKENNTATLIEILETQPDLPPTLDALATSHIHLNHNRTAAAFAPYHEHGFPDIAAIRQREDWHGWEQPDFQFAVNALISAYRSIISALTIDPNAGEVTRQRIITRLLDPSTMETLGRTRFAIACLDAAETLITIAGEAEHAFTLATIARNHGALAVPCLRVEALALTGLGKFAEAHSRWIHIISEYPASEHLAEDYTEAAYTAFENDNPRQAIEILITGVHRFGHDTDFAMRAAWIALLTGNSGQARAFLLKGEATGYGGDSIEHATLLLTIAAALDGDLPAANAHFQDLIALDPSWADPETYDAMPWPDHLIAPLRSLTQ